MNPPTTTAHLITTPARLTPCRCGTILVTGHAEGIRARCDPRPLTRAGHITAILTARITYRLTRTGLVQNDSTRIGSRTIDGPTLVEHQCGDTWPDGTFLNAPPTTVPENSPEGIPF